MQQYFVERINGEFRLNEKDLYHLKVVMRVKENDEICVICENKAYVCSFHYTNKDYFLTEMYELNNNPELDKEINLYQALIRNENFDLVIQKSTELGVSNIIPTVFERNVVKITDDKLESKLKRFNTISKGASEQSRRLKVPSVLNPIKVSDINLSDGEIGLVAYEKDENTKSIKELESEIRSSSKVSIVIGPEGGITPKEYQTLLDKGFKSVSLGKRILRSETASLSLLSILGYIIEMN